MKRLFAIISLLVCFSTCLSQDIVEYNITIRIEKKMLQTKRDSTKCIPPVRVIASQDTIPPTPKKIVICNLKGVKVAEYEPSIPYPQIKSEYELPKGLYIINGKVLQVE